PTDGAISTGSIALSAAGGAPGAISRRHLNSWLALASCRRATIETDAPGSSVSPTIRRFNTSGHCRRRPVLRRRLVSTKPIADTSVAVAAMPNHRAKRRSAAGALHRVLTTMWATVNQLINDRERQSA